uniref:Uncharacterized protein n=1 Tax=Anguilla anguilla TaxID=7936 RepID=A0A0E9VTF5_ANGAN
MVQNVAHSYPELQAKLVLSLVF